MLRSGFAFYTSSFAGLSRDIWLLGMVTLINRSGAMVIPFLTVYMTRELGFTKPQAGLAMSCFGIGSLIGSFAGGQLTDKIGYYMIQFWSLVLTGVGFVALMHVEGFPGFCLAVFAISIVAEAFRPANFAAVAAYAHPANITRSFSLIRLAINLGFSVGPALGGWLAHRMGYDWLFLVDGATCFTAAILFRIFLRPKREGMSTERQAGQGAARRHGAYGDHHFLMFMVFMTATAISFMQFFSVVPVYFREHFQFDERQIGTLLALNGLIIAIGEVPLVYRIEGRFPKYLLVAVGALLVGASFLSFNLFPSVWGIAVLSVVFVTLGEMLSFPFSNAVALERCDATNRGQYMGLYSMGFSLAHILSPSIGMQVAEYFGFRALWLLTWGIATVAALGFWWIWKRQISNSK